MHTTTVRRMIEIDTQRCNGCGLCAEACHEGAIAMVDGKATLIRDDYCDGLGDCLPVCPVDAIRFVEREALPYDEAAVQRHLKERAQGDNSPAGCPGARAAALKQSPAPVPTISVEQVGSEVVPAVSQLAQWPVQIKLVPVNAPYFEGAKLLIAADCAAYACGTFHDRFMKGHVTLIGCPKLDEEDYSEKLGEILRVNNIKSVTLVRMEVPCCGGLERALIAALQTCGKMIPWQVHTLSVEGELLDV